MYYQLTDTLEEYYETKTYFMNDSLFKIQQLKSLNPLILEGKSLEFYENGQLKYIIDYSNNMLNGNVIGYFENGQIKRHDFYNNDTFVSGKCFTKEGKDTSHYLYLKYPSFKNGGILSFRKYVAKNLKYPPNSAEQGVQGQVNIKFCVNRKGNVVDVLIINAPDDSLGEEAKRVVSSSPKWKPGIFEGKLSKFQFTIPVIFVLQ